MSSFLTAAELAAANSSSQPAAGDSDETLLARMLLNMQRSPADVAAAIVAARPLLLTLAGFKSNCGNSAAFPLTARVGPGTVEVFGKYNSSSTTGNNENHVQIPDVIMPWSTGAVAFGYNQLGTAALGTASTSLVGSATWMVTDAAGSPAPGFFTDPRAGARHVMLGHVIGGTLAAAPAAVGGGISVNASWPLPSHLSGGTRLALTTSGSTDDVVILFPGDLSNPKLAVVCHGAGAGAEDMINSGVGLTTAANYQAGSEPHIKNLLRDGYVIIASRGATKTEWGNELSYQMLRTAVAWIRQKFTFSKQVIVSVSMGGPTGLRLAYSDPLFTHWMGFDAVCDLTAAAAATVSTGECRKRGTSFAAAITAAHGGTPPAATNPVTWAPAGWLGKKLRFYVVGPDTATTDPATGCDGVIAPAYHSDAQAAIATTGGATVSVIRGTDTGGVGADHGRCGNQPLSSTDFFAT